MEEKKIDRRIKYTKILLRQSLLEIMKEKSINKISISEICDGADINRGTFYAHYSDQYDLLSQIENDLFSDINAALDNHDIKKSYDVIHDILKAIKDNSDICSILLGEFGDIEFLKKIIFIAHMKCINEWIKTMSPEDSQYAEYIYTFIANGSVGIIQQWITGGMTETHDKIAILIDKLSYQGIQAFHANKI